MVVGRGNGRLAGRGSAAAGCAACLPSLLPFWPSCPALNSSCPFASPYLCRRTTEELIAQCKAMVEAEEAQAQAAQQFGEGYINESDPSGTWETHSRTSPAHHPAGSCSRSVAGLPACLPGLGL
jgi:hypothetical protein